MERVWLAPVAPPLDVRIARAGWERDAFSAYCERCGGSVGAGEVDAHGSEFGCASCRDERIPWERFVRLGAYSGALAQWVQDTKFTRCHWLGESLGRLLGRAIRESGALGGHGGMRRVCVVPVATSFWRRVGRGIDHAACIARGVAGELDVPVVRGLSRKHRPTQRGLSPTARRANVDGAFTRRRGAVLEGMTVILVDDVRTTGATLRAAAKALMEDGRRKQGKEGGPVRLIAAVLTVTPEGRRRSEPGRKGAEADVDEVGESGQLRGSGADLGAGKASKPRF